MNFQYELKYGNYKRMTIKISRNGEIKVSAPYSYDKNLIAKIIADKKNWILKHISNIENISKKNIKPKKGEILYLGEIYTFEKNPAWGRTYFIDKTIKKILSGLDLTEKTNLIKFYSERAEFILTQKIITTAKNFEFEIFKARVHNTKKRWGSCTSNKIITLSSRLIMAPDFVIEAIILHELVHTKIMNHSNKFYKELRDICPYYDEATLWLKEKMPFDYPPVMFE